LFGSHPVRKNRKGKHVPYFIKKRKEKKIEMMVKAYKYHFSVSKLLSKNPTAISTIIVDQGTTLIL